MLNEIQSLITFLGAHLLWPSIAPGQLAAVALLMLFSLLMALESSYPHKQLAKNLLRQSYVSNAGLFVFNSIIVSFMTATSLLLASEHFADKGLLSYLPNPVWRAVVAFLCLDLLLYSWHKACHNFNFLWLFHRVHHSDAYINVSTAFRVHIAEVLLTTLLKLLYLIVLGLDKTLMLVIEAIFTGFVMFHHTNLAFYGEQYLNKFMVTPYLHRYHHSTERSQHDRNYGAVLSLWDRLFGTLSVMEPAAIGLNVPTPKSALGLVCFGFGYNPKAQPEPKAAADTVINLDEMIAEAAYYKAEKRSFSPGNELSDWLEAKREILRLVKAQQIEV